MTKHFYLDELLEDLRTLSEQYEVDENDSDVFLLKKNEIHVFADDLIKRVKEFIERDLTPEDAEEEEDTDEFDDVFLFDDDDDLE